MQAVLPTHESTYCIGMKIGLKGLREHRRNDNFQKSMQHNKAPHREIYDFFRFEALESNQEK